MNLGEVSSWVLILVGTGLIALLAGAGIYGFGERPTLLRAGSGIERSPIFWERMSVHLVFYAVWGIGFGAVLWRGVPKNMIDVRFAFERQWPVIQSTEWIYLSVYFVPLVIPWLETTRSHLRTYAFNLWWLLLISVVLFLAFPFGSPPREFQADSLAGVILHWETIRPDFAAASLPSFHVFWACLCADFVAQRGLVWRFLCWGWAVAVAVACVANGAHALVDIAVSGALYPLVTHQGSLLRRFLIRVETGVFGRRAVR